MYCKIVEKNWRSMRNSVDIVVSRSHRGTQIKWSLSKHLSPSKYWNLRKIKKQPSDHHCGGIFASGSHLWKGLAGV